MLRVHGGVLGFVPRTAELGRPGGGRCRASGQNVVVEDDVAKHVVHARRTSQRSDHANFEARQDRTRRRSKLCQTNQMTEVYPRVSARKKRERKQSRDSEAIE